MPKEVDPDILIPKPLARQAAIAIREGNMRGVVGITPELAAWVAAQLDGS
jgi:hypothetical protein